MRATNFAIFTIALLGILMCAFANDTSIPPRTLLCIIPVCVIIGAVWMFFLIIDIIDSFKNFLKQWLNE